MTPTLPSLAHFFLVSLSLGTAAFAWIADPKLTGAGFVRLITGHGFIALACAVIVDLVFLGGPSPVMAALYAVLGLLFAAQWRFHPDGKTPTMWVAFGAQVALSFAVVALIAADKALALPFLLSSLLLLGVTHYSMLLGHYYLVVPKLSERPLLVALRLFWAFLAAKLLFSAWQTWQSAPFLEEGTVLGDGYMFNWLVISMRWLWGYVALAILSWFAWRLCRMRSIQSATGVLYIMVFFVFVGELLSGYLFLKHGLAI